MRGLKRVAVGVAVLLLLAAASAVALILLVDPNDYKPQLAAAVKQRYDRTLRIDGDLRLVFFPRLGAEVSRLSLSEPRSAQIFAAVDAASVSVSLWPLLSRRLVVDDVRIEGLKANAVRYRDGRLNFADLLRPGASAAPPRGTPVPAPATPVEFDIAGITLDGGELAWRDHGRGTALRVERLSASTGRFVSGQPFDLTVSARLLGQAPRVDATVQGEARVRIDAEGGGWAAERIDLKAVGVLPSIRAAELTARGNLVFDGARHAYEASGIAVAFTGDVAGDRPLSGVEAKLEAGRLGVMPVTGGWSVERLAFSARGRLGAAPFEASLAVPSLLLPATQPAASPVTARLQVGDGEWDARLTLAGLAGNRDRLVAERLAVDAERKQPGRRLTLVGGSPLEASLSKGTLALDTFSGEFALRDEAQAGANMAVPLDGALRADSGKRTASVRLGAAIEGRRATLEADVSPAAPQLAFVLRAEALDVDAWLPRQPAPAHGRGGAAARPAPATRGDQAWPADLEVQGDVRLGRLTVRGVQARDVSAALRIADGRAELSRLRATLYGGTLSGSLAADLSEKRYTLAPVLRNVSLQPLLRDLGQPAALTGRASLTTQLAAAGDSMDAFTRSLAGDASLTVRDGALHGVDLSRALRALSTLSGTVGAEPAGHDSEARTTFSEMRAQLRFAAGVGTVRQLAVAAGALRLTEGSPARIDLPAGTLDTQLLLQVGRQRGALSSLAGLTVPVRVEGPLTAPAYRIQWGALGGEILRDGFERLLPHSETGPSPAEPADAAGRVRDRLRELFRR